VFVVSRSKQTQHKYLKKFNGHKKKQFNMAANPRDKEQDTFD
jgi:hypothetical protein